MRSSRANSSPLSKPFSIPHHQNRQHTAVEETLELLPVDDHRNGIVREQQVAAMRALLLSCATVAGRCQEGPGGPV